MRDQAAGTPESPVRVGAQHVRGQHPKGRRLLAQQRQRVAIQRVAVHTVVGQRFLGLGERGQFDRELVDAALAQHRRRSRVDVGDGPGRLVAVAGERTQRIGLRQALKLVGVQGGAAGQVSGADESGRCAGIDDAPARVGRQPGDAIEAEADRSQRAE